MKAQVKDIVKIQNRRVNAVLVGLSILALTLIYLGFRPLKYTEVPEVPEVQDTLLEISPIYMEIVRL